MDEASDLRFDVSTVFPVSETLPPFLPSSIPEDVEALATQLMGWTRGPWWKTGAGVWAADSSWNPFTDANADLQVLERVREVWGPPRPGEVWPMFGRWSDFTQALPDCSSYKAGAFARAALEVLREMEEG